LVKEAVERRKKEAAEKKKKLEEARLAQIAKAEQEEADKIAGMSIQQAAEYMRERDGKKAAEESVRKEKD